MPTAKGRVIVEVDKGEALIILSRSNYDRKVLDFLPNLGGTNSPSTTNLFGQLWTINEVFFFQNAMKTRKSKMRCTLFGKIIESRIQKVHSLIISIMKQIGG